jgi:hypothetical protein
MYRELKRESKPRKREHMQLVALQIEIDKWPPKEEERSESELKSSKCIQELFCLPENERNSRALMHAAVC